MAGQLGSEVPRPDDLDPVLDHGLTGLGQLAVATGFSGEVENHGAGAHVGDTGRGDQSRSSTARDCGRGDDHILLGRILVDRVADLLVLLVGEGPGVAALVLGVRDEVEFERASAERGDLFPGGATNVEAGDDRAEPLGGGDRLKSGDAGAEDEYPGRADRARRGGEHAPEAAGFTGGDQRRRVASGGRLRRKCVHGLGAGGPRDKFHRQGGNAARGESVVGLGRSERREVADQVLTLLKLADLGRRKRRDMEDQVGSEDVGM